MSDDQQQQPPAQPPQYPYYTITEDGLAELHREFGRMFHQGIEQRLTNGKLTQAGQRVVETSQAFQADHGPGKCSPLEQTNGHAEMPAVTDPVPIKATGRVRGG